MKTLVDLYPDLFDVPTQCIAQWGATHISRR